MLNLPTALPRTFATVVDMGQLDVRLHVAPDHHTDAVRHLADYIGKSLGPELVAEFGSSR